ncbi:hypothetical protein B0H11DRAFT_2273415 [Mycena galericulata]|nr:hypothetical protein B0H11DRAFT_2273415 [Mycena galericulata]
MSSVGGSSASLLMATLPSSTAAKFVLVALVVAGIACIIRATSPVHLIHALVSSLAAVESALIQVTESGTFRREYSSIAERLVSLQLDVSILREATLRDSLSGWAPFSQYLGFRRTLVILRCIREVRALEINIEILKELQLREFALEVAAAAAARTIFMRRRL